MELLKIQSVSGAHMIVDGREMLNFTGCSYLGICSEPALIEAGVEALKRYGSLGQIPRHYGALPPPYFEVEEAAARFFQSEAAMFFSQGYLFASVALQGLVDRYDLIFVDEGAHYAVKAAARAAEKPIVFYRHSDAEDLARKLRENLRPGQRPVVATDGMFPTWGNVPPWMSTGSWCRSMMAGSWWTSPIPWASSGRTAGASWRNSECPGSG